MKKSYFVLLACLLLVLASLLYKEASVREALTQSAPAVNHYWNDTARFLAGMTIRKGSPLYKKTRTSYYRTHTAKMNRFWEQVQSDNISRIAPWRDKNIPNHSSLTNALYPLSGYDFINLYTFYPKVQRYCMVSCEPTGTIPDPQRLSNTEINSQFKSLRRTVRTIATRNYFFSATMKQELEDGMIGGAAPVLMMFAARLNLTITGVDSVGLDKNGNLVTYYSKNIFRKKNLPIRGIRIRFFSKDLPSKERELLYLSMRLKQNSHSQKTPEGKFFARQKNMGAIIKSAIYLFHLSSYRNFCEFLINRIDILVQDDSAIPYRYLSKDIWNIKLFGKYTGSARLNNTPEYPQPNLVKDFRKNSTPLNFNFGYGFQTNVGESNMMLFIRKKHGNTDQ